MMFTKRRLLAGFLIWLTAAPLACNQSSAPSVDTPEPSDITPLPLVKDGIKVADSARRIECQDLPADFVTDLDLRQTPSLPEPDPRLPFRDPEFGTCLIRVTDRRSDISSDDASLGLKNEYARVQSFNADGSRFIIRGTDGTWYLYDAFTLRPLEQL
ncbi:MAG: hypothetical protein WA996_15225, partial [Candidatus Promineifilaceae bacterium]